MGAGSVDPLRRRLAYVCGQWQWRVTYLCPGESGRDGRLRSGLLVGPLVSDLDGVLWVAVLPDGCTERTMIRRDAITGLR